MNSYTFEKADKDLFAVYQTIYSDADIEMWYDWNARLKDTKWTDNCFWLLRDGEKIGGVIIHNNAVMSPFLIAPFSDRLSFWKLVLQQGIKSSNAEKLQLRGMLQEDVEVLMCFGAQVWRPRQIMVRPTDKFHVVLDSRYTYKTPEYDDIPLVAEVFQKSFTGGIAYQMFGEESIEQIVENLKKVFGWFQETNSLNQSVVVQEKATDKIVGACLAGIIPKMINGFSFLDDVFVLPEHRRQGISDFMIKYSLNAAFEAAPVMKLHVVVGNYAEYSYRKLGFIAGPRFTDMTLTI